MVLIAFGMLGVAACSFMIYVLVHFRHELLRGGKGSAGESNLTEVDVRRIEAALMLARTSSHAGVGQRAKNEAVMRKEMLTTAVIGLVGFLAPFIFVLLLNWSSIWHH